MTTDPKLDWYCTQLLLKGIALTSAVDAYIDAWTEYGEEHPQTTSAWRKLYRCQDDFKALLKDVVHEE